MTDKRPSNQSASQTVKRAADKLFTTFEAMISSGELAEGERLPAEREIVHTYGVSRTVVRETILALANKGLVEAKPRFRPVVARPNADTALENIESMVRRLLSRPHGVKNLFDTRILLETALVRQAALNAQKHDITALKTALAANEAAIDDSDKFYQTDMAFHALFYQVSGNPLLPAIHRAYTSWLAPQWSQMPRLHDRNLLNFHAHQSIFDAVLMRDPDAAEAILRHHLEQAWDQVQITFGDI